jgi:hypothetical protein
VCGVGLAIPALYGAEDPAPGAAPAAEAPAARPAPDQSLPPFLSGKNPIPDHLLAEKKENRYFTGLPLIGVDPEQGFQAGAALELYDNGPKDSPFFRYAPYRRRIAIGAAASTGGTQTYFVGLDQPYVNDTPWRIRAYGGYFQNNLANYFGTGEATLGPLTYPGSSVEYKRYDDYHDALGQVVNGETWKHYVDFRLRQWIGTFNVEYDLLGGRLRPLVGVQFMHLQIHDYTGETIDGAVMQETKLHEDNRLGRILGFDGGWDNNLRVGLAYDTRDYETDPTSGILAQALAMESLKAIGSEFDYTQATLGFSHFTSLFPEHAKLVFAGNYIYAMRFGDVPFYAQNRLAVPRDEIKTGLGGWKTLRGYHRNRFVGNVDALATWELRWSFADTELWKQHLRFMLAGFGDTGRVFDEVGRTTLHDWKFSYGGGLRLAWNLATVVSFEYGRSEESGLFYMELGHQF